MIWVKGSNIPALIVVGGGGGTLRAVIEAICEGSQPGNLPGRDRIRVAALRMGSGNIVAKQFGVPLNPAVALKGVVANLKKGRTIPCCIMRCQVGKNGAAPEIRYAVAMAGFGQFGRSPGDLARWRGCLPAIRRLIARVIGIERLNTIEYAASVFVRFFWCALQPNAVEIVELNTKNQTESMRLLAGVVMNFAVKQLPFRPDIRIGEAALSLNFVPYPGRWASLLSIFSIKSLARRAFHVRIESPDSVEIRLLNRDSSEFFMDEDPVIFYGKMKIQVAGTLAFVPGPEYKPIGGSP
ncbi:MAG: hypothetical protein HY662_03065 [Chloroflexi bacterium]|nr:hypothetical protein [Chloroflexota bacterium]